MKKNVVLQQVSDIFPSKNGLFFINQNLRLTERHIMQGLYFVIDSEELFVLKFLRLGQTPFLTRHKGQMQFLRIAKNEIRTNAECCIWPHQTLLRLTN